MNNMLAANQREESGNPRCLQRIANELKKPGTSRSSECHVSGEEFRLKSLYETSDLSIILITPGYHDILGN